MSSRTKWFAFSLSYTLVWIHTEVVKAVTEQSDASLSVLYSCFWARFWPTSRKRRLCHTHNTCLFVQAQARFLDMEWSPIQAEWGRRRRYAQGRTCRPCSTSVFRLLGYEVTVYFTLRFLYCFHNFKQTHKNKAGWRPNSSLMERFHLRCSFIYLQLFFFFWPLEKVKREFVSILGYACVQHLINCDVRCHSQG